ncbi:MAG TPA: sugar phosphate isomerase/epimerase [Candidatus Angelobacter sp.]|nr:sugar phosphate isomerase/epimerase [Candidatus Angelobacter sp.]
MESSVSRREFLSGLGALAAVAIAPGTSHALSAPAIYPPLYPAMLYPPRDLSYFDMPISAAPSDIRIGYAAITWGNSEKQAMEDIASAGYRGIQFRANATKDFQPAQLRDALQERGLTMVALSSGDVHSFPAQRPIDIAQHVANAKFLHDVGGLYLQLIDQPPPNQAATADTYKSLGSVLTEIGKRTADLGVVLGYHNHMNTLSEHPDGLDRVLDAADPRYVKLELDVAHCFEGGGDPVQMIEKYKERLLFLHLKDVEELPPAVNRSKPIQRFVELGQGKVDLPAVVKALHRIKFRGWAIVELDRENEASRTPKESALMSRKYLEERLGLAL